MSLDTETPLRSVAQLAKFLGVGTATVYRHCKSTDPAEHWPHTKIAGHFKFSGSQVERILALQSAQDESAPAPVAPEPIPVERLVRAARRQGLVPQHT